MSMDIMHNINNDINLKRFLRENSHWYKDLNRNSDSFKYFVTEMKEKYKLTVQDKIDKTIDNIHMVQSFLDVLN